jgi:hypothetical protein
MLDEKSIGLLIFTMLNALGVGFLLYALVHFWEEAHKSKRATSRRSELSAHGVAQSIFVVSAPVAAGTRIENDRVIRFPVRGESTQQRGNQAVRHAIR